MTSLKLAALTDVSLMQSYSAFTVFGLDGSCTCQPDASGTPVATCP